MMCRERRRRPPQWIANGPPRNETRVAEREVSTMPIFEYECKKCGKLFEELVMKEGVEVRCPCCGSTSLDKLISAFAKKCQGCSSSGGAT
jgi:putative FmdB family regulatory protein